MHFEEEKHNFTFRFDSNDGEVHLEMNCNELYLGDILERFREFLLGCGYQVNGYIDVISEEESSVQEPPLNYNEYDGYRMTEPPQHEPKWDFNNIPNNNWPFGGLTPQSIPALTTTQINSFQSTSINELKANPYPTMAPLSTQQVYSWSADLPSNNGEKIKVRF